MIIENKVFIVTGGSTGLGSGVVEQLAQQGAIVVIADLRRDAAEQLIKDLKDEEAVGQVFFNRLDVNDVEAVQRVVPKIAEQHGAIHGLINCAGNYPFMPLIDKEDDDELHRIDTFICCLHINLVGTFSMIRAATPYILQNQPDARGERGVVVSTSSSAAEAGHLALSAAAGGIDGMLGPLVREFAGQGIRFNTVAPLYIQTRMWRDQPDAAKDALQSRALSPTPGKVADFAAITCQLIENAAMNGQRIALDMGASV